MAVRIQVRRGTASEWTTANTILSAGEIGFESDTNKFKIGDGAGAWNSLPYAAVSSEVLAQAITDHNDLVENVHGIANTALLETQSGAQDKANSAVASANQYTDNAIANVIDSSPEALNTLNELAAALGNDENFATTVSTSLGQKINYVYDTEANFTAANATTSANTIYVLSDDPTTIKIGDGSTAYVDLDFIGKTYTDDSVGAHVDDTVDVHGIANTANLVFSEDLSVVAGDLTDHINETMGMHGIVDSSDLVVSADLDPYAPLESPTFTTSATLPPNTTIGDITATEISYLANASSEIQAQLDTLSATASANYNSISSLQTTVADKADLASPTFSGTVTLPGDTSIGSVSSIEIGYLDNVTSSVQDQLDAKLGSSTAASTYAPIANATLTGTVSLTGTAVLPADTSIGDVSSTEISYLNNVSSAIQDQIDGLQSDVDGKLGTSDAANTYAPIDSPTFTTSAVLPEATDIGNVSATEITYLSGVTSGIQTQLDSKAALAGATFSGDVEIPNITVTGNLIVSGTTTTVNAQNLSVRDNMVYLNADSDYTLSDAVGDGTNVVYTINETTQGSVGDFIIVSNTTPSSFNTDTNGLEIIAITSNTITVASTVIDTYVSGGDVMSRTHTNPDLGWAGGHYHDNTYQHAGVFLDATDQTFKFFDGYIPEPDEDVFINTSHASFALSPIQVSDVTAENVIANTAITFGDGTVQISAGVASITGFTEKTASYQLDTLDHQDNVVEMNSSSAVTFTIPLEATFSWPVGASMDIIQTGTGQVTVDIESGGTLNYTPGNKLRTQWSSCTIMKRAADSWILYGDLTA